MAEDAPAVKTEANGAPAPPVKAEAASVVVKAENGASSAPAEAPVAAAAPAQADGAPRLDEKMFFRRLQRLYASWKVRSGCKRRARIGVLKMLCVS